VTAACYAFALKKLHSWMKREGLTAEVLTYRHMLGYVKQRLLRGGSKRDVNQGLTAARHYFDYLIHKGITDYNPAINLYVRGEVRRLPHGLLERQELDMLYYATGCLQRKVLVGLLVFQGLSVGELQILEPGHVDLEQGLLQVPATRRSNGRVLRLEETQLAPLREYLDGYVNAWLLTAPEGGRDLTNVLMLLMEKLRRTNPGVRNATQLRMSVISHWLKRKDVRVVQHMAGHRHVSSTERYRQDRMQSLQRDVESFHPLE
jgi:integrase/recombinase XerD